MMRTEEIISRAARLLIQWRPFWALGFLMVLGSLVNGIIWRLTAVPQTDLTGDDLPARLTSMVEEWLLEPARPILGVVALVLAGLIFWLVAAVAEGGIIRATAAIHAGQPVSFHQAWAGGRKLLVRFVAIDTILFLPLFGLLQAIMLVGAAGFFGTIVINLQRGGTLADILEGLGLTAVVALPMVCLLLPVGLITYFMRLAAFREAALNEATAGQSIRHGWRILRENVAAAAGLAILLYAIRYLIQMLLSIVTVPLMVPSLVVLLSPWFNFRGSSGGFVLLAVVGGLVATVINAAGNALLSAYGSIGWTLAYDGWLARRTEAHPEPGSDATKKGRTT